MTEVRPVGRDVAPRLTVGLPVFNGENYIAAAIASVLDQTFDDFELIVSDNASTDATAEIVQGFVHDDPRVRYQRHDANLGAHNNYDSIVPLARGDYFKWLAHDDVLEPTFFERCVGALDADPEAGLAFAQADVIDGDGKRIGELRAHGEYNTASAYGRLRTFVAERTRIPHVFGVMRRDVLESTPLLGSYPKSDLVFMYEMSMRTRFARIDEPLLLSRDHPSRLGAKPLRDRTTWYHPDRRSPMLPRWSQLAGFLGAVLRVPMPAREKLQCLAFAGYWGLRHADELAGDVVYRLRYEFDRLRHRS